MKRNSILFVVIGLLVINAVSKAFQIENGDFESFTPGNAAFPTLGAVNNNLLDYTDVSSLAVGEGTWITPANGHRWGVTEDGLTIADGDSYVSQPHGNTQYACPISNTQSRSRSLAYVVHDGKASKGLYNLKFDLLFRQPANETGMGVQVIGINDGDWNGTFTLFNNAETAGFNGLTYSSDSSEIAVIAEWNFEPEDVGIFPNVTVEEEIGNWRIKRSLDIDLGETGYDWVLIVFPFYNMSNGGDNAPVTMLAGLDNVFIDILQASPYDKETGVDPILDMLTWNLPDPNDLADSVVVDVYYSSDPNELDLVIEKQAVEQFSVIVEPESKYYWRIIAYDTGWEFTDENGIIIDTGVMYFETGLENKPPVVNAGEDGYSWLEDGSAPYLLEPVIDDDGRGTLAYQWSVVSEPNDVTNPVQIASPTEADTDVTMTLEGDYEFELEVSDNGAYIVTDRVIVTIHPDGCVAASNELEDFEWLPGDANQDCKVTIDDFAAMAANWLMSNYLERDQGE
ncbi:MAG: hypothetical protein MI866_06460 [Bacteroidales bacterium]|nr:hypothetical protein [Bacteroidales bacterium]